MKYKALGQINHNNVIYQSGDAIELSSNEAAPLLEVKAIEPFRQPFAQALKIAPGESEGGEG